MKGLVLAVALWSVCCRPVSADAVLYYDLESGKIIGSMEAPATIAIHPEEWGEAGTVDALRMEHLPVPSAGHTLVVQEGQLVEVPDAPAPAQQDAKVSATAKLKAWGMTEEEIQVLLP